MKTVTCYQLIQDLEAASCEHGPNYFSCGKKGVNILLYIQTVCVSHLIPLHHKDDRTLQQFSANPEYRDCYQLILSLEAALS